MNNVLLNMPVKLKLLTAFGLLLLLTVGASLASYSAFDNLTDGNKKVKDVASINNLVKDARFNEKNFFMRNDQRYVENTLSAIKAAGETAELAAQTLESPEQKTAMEKVQKDLVGYQAALLRMVEQRAQSGAALKAMEASAREAVEGFTHLEQFFQARLLEQLAAGQDNDAQETLRLVRLAGELARDVLDARRIEKNFVISENPEAAAELNQRIDSVEDGLSELAGFADTTAAQTRIEQLETALESYGQQFVRLTRNVEDMNQDEARVTELARDTIAQAGAALAEERMIMDEVRDNALLILFGATITALVFGIGAALLVTRTIVGPLDELVSHAGKVADGDLSNNIHTDRKDDLGRLMMAMQVMTENLRHMVKEVSDGISQIASSAEELSSVTEQTSAGANQQRDETDQVATAMNEMTATIQEVA